MINQKSLFIFSLLNIFLLLNIDAYSQCNEWVKNSGPPTSSSIGLSSGMTSDENKNIYTAKLIDSSYTINYGDTLINSNLSYPNTSMLVVSKVDSAGTPLWHFKIETQFMTGRPVGLHYANNNLYLSTTFIGAIHLDGQGTIFTNGNIFLVKLNANGSISWFKNYSPLTNSFLGTLYHAPSVITDHSGNVILTGHFAQKLVTDNDTLVADTSQSSDRETFIIKVDSNGNELWTKQSTKIYNNTFNYSYKRGDAVAVDNNNDIFVGGFFTEEIIFDTIYASDSSLNYTPYIAKFNGSTGSALWIKNGTYNSNHPYAHFGSCYNLAVDSNNNVIATGAIDTSFTIENLTFNTNGNRKILLAKYSSQGNLLFAKSFGSGSLAEAGLDLLIEENNNILLTGTTSHGAQFDNLSINSNSQTIHSFIARLDSNGSVQSLDYLRGRDEVRAYNIEKTSNENYYLSGFFSNSDTLFNSNQTYFENSFSSGHFFYKFCLPSTVTSFEEISSFNQTSTLSIQPNPVISDLNLRFNLDQDDSGVIQIFNLNGKLMISKKMQLINRENTVLINCENLTSGSYFIKYIGKNGTAEQKFIKL